MSPEQELSWPYWVLEDRNRAWHDPKPDQGKLNPQFSLIMVLLLHWAPREPSWASPRIVRSNSHCMHRAEFILHKERGNCSFRGKKTKTTQNNSYLADTDLYTCTRIYIYIFYWQIKKDQIFNEIRMGLGGELELNSPDFHGTSIKRVSEELLKAKHLPLKA